MRAGLADVAPLQVARVGDGHVALFHPVRVDMAQRPVLVALGVQLGRRAGGVAGVLGVALQRGVQHADVEPAGHRRGVAGHQVVGGGGVLEALAVQRHLERGDAKGLGAARGKHLHVVRQLQAARDFAFGVVVAVEQVYRDARLAQPPHLAHEEQAGVIVLPIAVVQIAGNHHEVHLLLDGARHQPLKGLARGCAQALGRRVGIGRQADQRAVEVDVGGVDEFHGGVDVGSNFRR